ncbi:MULTISPECIES: hypothetical protein [unclassified Synechocystis]|uniref:hypothetical protein n=1 Tax=unclassified Synechocystis TaxID=2640012 RepID=UPI00040C441C|nr:MULTISPECIES: hypothetical protein [unclassified Synechocystis]AIE75699.1 hypothetical protein D082_31710 [Synechocystis sp. PCC 6714]
MLIPVIGFGLAVILLIGFFLLYQEIGIFKSLKFLIVQKNNPFFILAFTCFILALALGLVGYWGILEPQLSAADLQALRRNLLILSILLGGITFRHYLLDFFKPITNIVIWQKIGTFGYKNRIAILTYFLLALIALAWMAPMASAKIIFSINDHTSHIGYIVQARMALEEGQFPLRVAPLENFGFRYPGFQFYSQLPYFFGAIIYKFFTPTNPYTAYKILLWLSLWLGGVFIYRLGFFLTRSHIASVLGGVTYMSAPYFLNNVHARGAFTEAIAQGILAIVLFYVFQTFYYPHYRHLIYGALAWCALGLTHIITFVYTTIFIALLGGIFLLKNKPNYWQKGAIYISLSYVWAWLLALYFLAPVALESSNLAIRRQIEAINPFNTTDITPIANLLAPNSLPHQPTELGIAPTYGFHPAVGWILLASFGTVIYFVFASQSLPRRLWQSQPWFTPLVSVFIVALFLTWSPINIWNILPRQLWVTQFTFRFLTHVMWSGALLTTLAIILIFRERLRSRHLILGILIIVIASRPWLPIPRGTVTVEELLQDPLFRYSGALDYLYRLPNKSIPVSTKSQPAVEKIYGKAELQLLHPDWIPGYLSWDVFINGPLPIDVDIPYPTWPPQEKPTLVLQGRVPMDKIKDQANLIVFVDQQPLASIPLNQEQLKAEIPFSNIQFAGNGFELKFIVDGETTDGNPLYIRMDHLYFDGFSPENTLLPVDVTREMCSQKGSITDCEIDVTKEVSTIQLPILYYPQMQQILLDNQPVEGFFTNYYDFNLLTLSLSPGKHQIQVKFMGLIWANWISLLAWLTLIVTAIALKFYPRKPESTIIR